MTYFYLYFKLKQIIKINIHKDFVVHYTNGKPVITYNVDKDTHNTIVVDKKGWDPNSNLFF